MHEIRNHLTALSALSQILPAKKNDPVFLETFQRLMAHELDRLMDLTLQSPRPRKSKKEQGIVDLTKVLGRAIQLMNPLFLKKRIRVDFKVESGLILKGVESQLESLALNLLRNASDSVGPEGRIEVVAARKGKSKGAPEGWIQWSVRDDGPGIPRKILGKIFEPYFSTKKTGTGLGLAICQKIVEDHRGRLTASNSSEKGAVFSVLLPLVALGSKIDGK